MVVCIVIGFVFCAFSLIIGFILGYTVAADKYSAWIR